MDIRKQTIVNSLGSAVLLGFQWLISVCLVRTNGYEDAGVFSLAMTVSNIFSTAANYGLRNYQLTDHSRRNKQDEYLIMRLISSAFASGTCTAYLYLNKNYTAIEKWAIGLYLLYNLTIVINDSLMGSIQLENHLELNGFSNILRGMFSFALFLGALLLWEKLLPALGMMVLASLLVLLMYDLPQYVKLCTERKGRWRGHFRGSCSLFVEGFPVMLSSIIPMMVTALPRTILQNQMGSEYLGFFSSVYTPAVLLSTVLPPALISIIPAISQYWHEENIREMMRNVAISYGVVCAAICGALAVAGLAGRLFLTLLYGDSILPYANLLYYAILAVGMSCVCTCGNNIVVAIGGKRMLLFMSGLTLGVTLAFSGTLVSAYGIIGAAIVQIIAYGLQAVIQLVYLSMEILSLNRHGAQ